MYCHSCGKQLVPNSAYCNACGTPVKSSGASVEAMTSMASLSQTSGLRTRVETNVESGSEQVIFRIRPAFYDVGFAYVTATILSILLAATGYFGLPFQVILIAALLVFLYPIYKHIQWSRIIYTLTSSKIEIDSGLLAKTVRNLPLRNIQDVTTSATIGQRLIGLGDVIIDSASDTGKITMRGIRNPRKFADLVLAQLHRWN